MDGELVMGLTERVYIELKGFRKISPLLVMKKYKLSEDLASKICRDIWLKQHLEAREWAKDIEN